EAYTTSLLEEAPCPPSIWIHNDMAREVHLKGNMNPYHLKEAYHTYDHIVPVSEDLIQPVVCELGADRSRITVIHNCHDYQSVLERSLAPVAFNED
ncbi:teichoic acid biosynthesis protein TagF, partial [Blautia schinkii]|nr:teichoic acid biosynthesis protein TagF [Blautia schinkii]